MSDDQIRFRAAVLTCPACGETYPVPEGDIQVQIDAIDAHTAAHPDEFKNHNDGANPFAPRPWVPKGTS